MPSVAPFLETIDGELKATNGCTECVGIGPQGNVICELTFTGRLTDFRYIVDKNDVEEW